VWVKALARHACGGSSATPALHWRVSVAVRAALTPGGGRRATPLVRTPAVRQRAAMWRWRGEQEHGEDHQGPQRALSAEDALGCLL